MVELRPDHRFRPMSQLVTPLPLLKWKYNLSTQHLPFALEARVPPRYRVSRLLGPFHIASNSGQAFGLVRLDAGAYSTWFRHPRGRASPMKMLQDCTFS